MKRVLAVIAASAAVIGVGSAAAPVDQASALTTVWYANDVGVAPGIHNLLSTPGSEYRTYNQGFRSINTGVNVPVRIRNLRSSGGVVGETGGVNSAYFSFPAPLPHSKSQCWVPTHAGGWGGILSCVTTRP